MENEGLTLEIIEATDAQLFKEKVNEFLRTHKIDRVDSNSTSFTMRLTKYVAQIWHFGPKPTVG